ncbi:MAG: hypothetical protein KF773_32920 [Deltaproteobacteria bacterium]|nr:hypothetical protein [Deltaproteobacteria bacterium]
MMKDVAMMDSTELRAALVSAFPPAPITHTTIHTPDARWGGYGERDDLMVLEGKAWSELGSDVLRRHRALLTYAGGPLYRAILPAYLLLIAEHENDTPLALHLAGELTRTENATDQEIFDERVRPMTDEQRAVVRRAIVFLARRSAIREVMAAAFRSW